MNGWYIGNILFGGLIGFLIVDPLTGAMLPPTARNRHRRLAAFMGLGVTGAIRRGEVWTTPDHAASAVWRAPGQWKVGGAEALRGTPAVTRVLGRNVLRAMRIDEKLAHGAIRFSLSRYTTEAEVARALDVLPGVVSRLRAVLPV